MKTGRTHFSRGPRTRRPAWALAVLFLVSFARLLEAAEPKQETLRAWDEYTQIVNLRLAQDAVSENQFLWIDQSHDLAWRVHQYVLVVTDNDPMNIPKGMIHNLIGSVFVPKATLDQALTVVESFDRYSEFYKPLFGKCTVLARDSDQATLNVVAAQKVLSVTAAVDTEAPSEDCETGS